LPPPPAVMVMVDGSHGGSVEGVAVRAKRKMSRIQGVSSIVEAARYAM
jgi:hypothetical protein